MRFTRMIPRYGYNALSLHLRAGIALQLAHPHAITYSREAEYVIQAGHDFTPTRRCANMRRSCAQPRIWYETAVSLANLSGEG